MEPERPETDRTRDEREPVSDFASDGDVRRFSIVPDERIGASDGDDLPGSVA
jgi:hypothetical protein